METPPPPPDPSSGAAERIPGGGGNGDVGAERSEAAGFSSESASLWSSLFVEPELEPMWSPPRGFGVGDEVAAAPEAEAEADDAGGPWDGAPWRSSGVVPDEGAATVPAPAPASAACFAALELAAPDPASGAVTASPGAVLEVRPLEGGPDSSSPAPVDERALESVAGSESAPSLELEVVSSAENSGERILDCTLNSVPSPLPSPPLDIPDLEAEEAPKGRCALEKISPGTMLVIGLDADGDPENNAGCGGMPDVIIRVGRSLRRSPRLATMNVKANLVFPEREVVVSRALKRRLANSGLASNSEGNQLPESTSSLVESAVSAKKLLDPPNVVERQGPRESIVMQSSSAYESQGSGQGKRIVVDLPVASERSIEDEVVSVYSAGSIRSASKALVSEMPLELEETPSQPPEAKRVRMSNMERAESSSGTSCQSPSAPENKAKHMLDSQSRDSKMECIDDSCFFMGEAVPDEEAKQRWPHRYRSDHRPLKKDKRSSTRTYSMANRGTMNVKCHYMQASVCGSTLCIGDCAFIKGPEGKPHYIGRLLEFFETIGGESYVSVQWFFRAEDTVMHDQAQSHDQWRIFYSELKDDNLLDCIISKVTVTQVSPSDIGKSMLVPPFEYYYDMKYSQDYSTFSTMETGELSRNTQFGSQSERDANGISKSHYRTNKQKSPVAETMELSLLDLYSGCGGMSTGLCLGARAGGVNLVARWAVDGDEAACESFRLNHPETRIHNETTEDFLELLKEWKKLCNTYTNFDVSTQSSNETPECSTVPPEEFEVLKLVNICFGDPNEAQRRSLYFKVRWKGYGPNDDTWEPVEGLDNCKEAIGEFVSEGKRKNILPLPGGVDVICGGPPCQGISGYNRKRKFKAPFTCQRNKQIIVFMDIIQFLKPKYIYMENVLDILKFADATIARYALSRLIAMHYQAKLGIMAAASYGVPQFRMRAFLLGCHRNEKLPPFPLPTHEAILKNGCPLAFEHNLVGWPDSIPMQLEKPIVLEDILSDLPEVINGESRDEMLYVRGPQTEFQRYIRTFGPASESKLYDHRPKVLDNDNYIRVSKIPKEKGANFRNLSGVIVGSDNIARLEPTMERELLPCGRPLVVDCMLSYQKGKSRSPYGRLWWDDVVGTVLTAPNPLMQALIHPVQDRLLTIRETARLQGFPDSFRFHGTVKDRYRQIGNAVAIPVGRALGYTLAMACLKRTGEEHLMELPPKFSLSHEIHDSSIPNGLQQTQ